MNFEPTSVPSPRLAPGHAVLIGVVIGSKEIIPAAVNGRLAILTGDGLIAWLFYGYGQCRGASPLILKALIYSGEIEEGCDYAK